MAPVCVKNYCRDITRAGEEHAGGSSPSGEPEAVQGFHCGVLLLLPLAAKACAQTGIISGKACGLCCTRRSGWFMTVVPSSKREHRNTLSMFDSQISSLLQGPPCKFLLAPWLYDFLRISSKPLSPCFSFNVCRARGKWPFSPSHAKGLFPNFHPSSEKGKVP